MVLDQCLVFNPHGYAEFLFVLLPSFAHRYTNKKHEDAVFELVSIESNHVVFKHQPLFGEPTIAKADFDQLKFWKVTKKECPLLCEQEMKMSKMVGGKGEVIKVDMVKSGLQEAINDFYLQNLPKVEFALHPTMLFAGAKFKKGELQLIPAGLVQTLKPEEKVRGIKLRHKGYDFQLVPYKAASEFDMEKGGNLVPFFWVQTHDQEEEVNMGFKNVTVKGMSLPTLVNTKPLTKNQPLYMAPEPKTEEPKAKKAKIQK